MSFLILTAWITFLSFYGWKNRATDTTGPTDPQKRVRRGGFGSW